MESRFVNNLDFSKSSPPVVFGVLVDESSDGLNGVFTTVDGPFEV